MNNVKWSRTQDDLPRKEKVYRVIEDMNGEVTEKNLKFLTKPINHHYWEGNNQCITLWRELNEDERENLF